MGFKHKNLLRVIGLVSTTYMVILAIFFIHFRSVWNTYDYKILDLFYKQAVQHSYGPKPSFSPEIVYLTITDASYDAFGKNILDRKDMARVNQALADLEAEAVAYDIIFARPSPIADDQAFTRSLDDLGTAWLPFGLALSESPVEFKGRKEADPLIAYGLDFPVQSGKPTHYYASRALMQYQDFSEVAAGSGNISVIADSDSVYRHLPLLVKADEFFYPTLSFSLFLDWARVSPDKIRVDWGRQIFIQATEDNMLEQDYTIPIDEKGRLFVPFVDKMGKDFKHMPAHTLVESYADENLRGNLYDIFEGNFILVADVATGTSDLGDTPLETDVPLVILHASALNGMLTHTFYSPWPFGQVLAVIFLLGVLLTAAAAMKSPWFLYGTGAAVLAGVLVLTWIQFLNFSLFPVATVSGVILFIFAGLTVTLEAATAKDRAFIKNTFSKYVPKKVVAELLNNPGLVALRGEERMATVFFSDIVGFTSVSEKLSPHALVSLLNEYLTGMTEIILDHEGIIDKYLGDAIMAEFGVPLASSDHADQAVSVALQMQARLREMRKIWQEKGLPQLNCRVGINTNTMVVGNIGSTAVFDYTVIGDAVNLASRLEGANKRYGTAIMISQNTYEQMTPGKFKTRLLDFIIVKGKTRPVKIYEVYGFEKADPEEDGYHTIYEAAFNHYLDRNFSSAAREFEKALALYPEDPAAGRMIKRINRLASSPLPDDWNGAVALTEK